MSQQTKDYEIFKKHASNRPINETLVHRLMNSISEKNLLKIRPIVVNDEMQILDGQHRLEAARRLGIPIYYQIEKQSDDIDMIRLNANQNSWRLEDYHNFYVSQGNQEYQQLDHFLKNHSLTLHNFIKLDGYSRKNNRSMVFKNGGFVMPTEDERKAKLATWTRAKELINFIGKRRSDLSVVLRSVNFQRGLVSFLSRNDVEYDELKNRLEIKIDIVGPRAGVGGYYSLFLEIYNFRRREPIAA